MKRNVLIIGSITILLIVAAAAYLLRPSEEASAPIEAVPLEVETEASITSADAEPTEDTPIEPETAEKPAESAGTGTVVYVISQGESEVRFSIDELLRNVPVTAVGITDQIAGEISIDFDTPSNSQMGQITVNARTLATDNSNRNRMIQNQILDTADYEFINFKPTAITGLPGTIAVGEAVSFQVAGDLTIRAITVPATFDVSAAVDAEGNLTGSAVTTVLRSDYELTIPSVPSVADVSDEVILEIDFTAKPK